MADGPPGAVALISIHPRFANAILDGTKQVEFRKVGFKRVVAHALLYATSPIQQIVGFVEVSGIDACSPTTLWRRYHEVGGIDREAFFDYYEDRSIGFALKIQRPRRLRVPINLSALKGVMVPPQSFLYSTAEALRRVRALATSPPT